MTRSTLLRAATLACAALLSACAPSRYGMYGPSLGDLGPRSQLAPAEWTAASPAGEISAWLRQGCRRASGGKQACVERGLTGLIDQAGIAKSMEVLDTLVATDAEVRLNAHALAHGLGIAAYRSPETVAATFAGCTPSQMSGCYHGVIQGYFLAMSAAGQPIGTAQVDALCAPHEASTFLFFQCAHGLGHGLMALHEHDVPMSLEGCDLATNSFIRESCYGGVFMENVVNVTHPHHTAEGHAGTQHGSAADAGDAHAGMDHGGGHAADGSAHAGMDHGAARDSASTEHASADHMDHGSTDHGSTDHSAMNHGAAAMAHGAWKVLDRNDFQYPCNAVEAKYRDSCYTMQTSAVLYFTNGDVGATARACERAEAAYQATCFASLGRDVTALAAQNHRRSLELCARAGGLAGGRGETWCQVGVAQNLVNLAADPAEGLGFCTLVQGQTGKDACYRAVGQAISALEATPEGRRARCAASEVGFVAACLRGASVASPADD